MSARLTVSAFNWAPQIVRAENSAATITSGVVGTGGVREIEFEAGQVWRGFPAPTNAEAMALRDRLNAVGGAVSIVGISIDEWDPRGIRRGEDEREAFVLPQLRAAAAVGAEGVRLPIGQAGPVLLRRLLPHLHDLDLVLHEEVQGVQTPADPRFAAAYDDIATVDDERIRLLVDISMLMPAPPVSYVEALGAAAADTDLVRTLTEDWRDPDVVGLVLAGLRDGRIPRPAEMLAMDVVVRFGRSEASVIRDVLPLVGAFHLKFWDLEDADGRITSPLRDIGELLRGTGFAGTLCSEWGGHAWLERDPTEMTAGHLELVRGSLDL